MAAGLGLAALLIFGGCASPLPVTSNPDGATVVIGGKMIGSTPTQYQLPDQKPVTVEFSKEGYFPESFVFQPGPSQTVIHADLAETTLTKTFDINSNPEGATVTIDGQDVGPTPVRGARVVFTRDYKAGPWKPKNVVVAKTNYQTESIRLGDTMDSLPRFDLSLLREDRVYSISATAEGNELHAEVTVNGRKLEGTTPLKYPVTFSRPNKQSPWNKFNVEIEIPAKYKKETSVIDFPSSTTIALKLNPVTEITTTFMASVVTVPVGGVGAEMTLLQRKSTAILNARETSEIISDLKQVTPYTRKDLQDSAATRADNINSYCVTPDGQNVIYSLTQHDEQGNYYSNLVIKRSEDMTGGMSKLTESSRFMDTQPYIGNDTSNLVVFTTNRSDRKKPDIYRFTLVDNRLSNGPSRMTNDQLFNTSPSYGDSKRQIFYISTEPNFPKAEPTISWMKEDGALATPMSVTATELTNAVADKVYFVKKDPDTKKQQIYWMTPDGKNETALINTEGFEKSNCFNPAVSPDGSQVMFVSDHGTDDQGRLNNDIYLVSSSGTNLQRLTQNGSDDIQPAWSPSGDGVVYFLSNRGGAYNIWRMKLAAGTK